MTIVAQGGAEIDIEKALLIFTSGVNYGLSVPQSWPADPAMRELLERVIDLWHTKCAAEFPAHTELPPAATSAWLRQRINEAKHAN